MKLSHVIGIAVMAVSGILHSQEKDTIFILPGVEITSARKTTTSYNEPLAITVMTAKDFSKSKGYGLDDALTMVPGVFAQSRYGNQDIRVTIRGFGARGAGERSNTGTSRGIRILLDGFPETEPDGRSSFDLLDVGAMNRIEVIRSNASAVWGNGAGGLVSISSNTSFDNPFVTLQSSAGSFGFQKSALYLGTNIGTGKFFLNLSNTNSEGWREHSRSTQTLLNFGIISSLAERTKLGVFIVGTTNLFHIPGPLSQAQFDVNPRQAQADTSYYKPSYVQRDERRYNRLGRIGISLSHSFDEANDLSATAFVNPKYLQRSERNTFRDFTRYHVGGSLVYHNSYHLTETVHAATTFGADEAYQDGAILFYQLKNGQRDSILADNKREGANSFGIFIQEDVTIKQKLSLSLGVRYDDVTYIAENFMTPANLSDKRSFSKMSPKAGIVYRFTPTHSVYASLGGGVEVPAGNETDPAQGQTNSRSINPLLEPIVSMTYEIGTKQFVIFEDFPLRAIAYDVAAYVISTTNDIVPYQGGRFYLTAGKTRRVGAELGLSSHLDYGFSINTAMTISNNIYTDYTIDSVFTKRPIAPSLSGKTISYKDHNVVGIPGLLLNVKLRYDVAAVEGLYGELSSQSVGDYYADDANTLLVQSYSIYNATIGYSGPLKFIDNVFVKAFITMNNMTDKKYASSVYINPDYGRVSSTANQAIFLEPGFPKYLVASLGLNYNF